MSAKATLALLIIATIMLGGAGGAAAKPGDLDTSYGDNGIKRLTIPGGDIANSATLDAGGRLIIAGTKIEAGDRSGQVTRLTTGGEPDPTFGGGAGYIQKDPTPESDFIDSIAIAPNGDLLMGGTFGFNPSGDYGKAGLIRLNPDGLAAPGFGSNGIVLRDFGNEQRSGGALALPGGKLLWYGRGADPTKSLQLACFDSSGVPDQGFSSTGLIEHDLQPLGSGEQYETAILQPDGKILVGGEGSNPSSWILARFNPDGSLDPSFGGDGVVETSNWPGPRDPFLYGLALDAHGRIVAVGTSGYKEGLAVARFLPNGTLDSSFVGEPGFSDPVMDDGMLNIDYGATDTLERATSVAIQDNGKILLVGQIKAPGASGEILVVRLKPNGEYDPTFGNPDGRTLISVGGLDDVATEVLLQDDGKILVAGTTGEWASTGDFVAVRLEGDPPGGSAGPSAPAPGGIDCSSRGDSGGPPTPPTNLNTTPQLPKDGWVHVSPRGKWLTLNRRGIAQLRLRCAAREVSPPCIGRVVVRTPRLRIGKRKRSIVLARAKFRMGAGKTKAVRLKLGKGKQRLVRNRRAARRVQVQIRVRDRAGNRKTIRRTMRLRPAPVRGQAGIRGRAGRR